MNRLEHRSMQERLSRLVAGLKRGVARGLVTSLMIYYFTDKDLRTGGKLTPAKNGEVIGNVTLTEGDGQEATIIFDSRDGSRRKVTNAGPLIEVATGEQGERAIIHVGHMGTSEDKLPAPKK